MGGNLDGAFGHAEILADPAIGIRLIVSLQQGLEPGEQRGFSRIAGLGLETLEDEIEEDERPPALEELLRSQIVRRLAAVTPLGVEQVDRDLPSAAASFEGAVVISSVRQVMETGRAQEGPEPTPGDVDGLQRSPLDQAPRGKPWMRSPASS